MRVFAFVAILLIGAAAGDFADRYAEDAADMHGLTELQERKIDERALEVADRWGLWCSSNFCSSTISILQKNKMYKTTLTKASSIGVTTETIEWTQASKCGWWSCREDYQLAGYYATGSKIPVYVYVAKASSGVPNSISTNGYKGLLHCGNLIYDNVQKSKAQVMFFVIHPNSWGPYQHRFKTSSLTKFVNGAMNDIIKAAVGAGVGAGLTALMVSAAAAGGTLGSIVPVAGTAAGALAGIAIAGVGALAAYAVGSMTDDYLGDYLRYIG